MDSLRLLTGCREGNRDTKKIKSSHAYLYCFISYNQEHFVSWPLLPSGFCKAFVNYVCCILTICSIWFPFSGEGRINWFHMGGCKNTATLPQQQEEMQEWVRTVFFFNWGFWRKRYLKKEQKRLQNQEQVWKHIKRYKRRLPIFSTKMQVKLQTYHLVYNCKEKGSLFLLLFPFLPYLTNPQIISLFFPVLHKRLIKGFQFSIKVDIAFSLIKVVSLAISTNSNNFINHSCILIIVKL